MATQLATTDGNEGKALAKAPVTSGNKLAAFVPNNLEEAWRLAGALAASGMTPKAYGNDQNKCMVGIIAGAEVGLTPFAALQSIAVIGNNPSIWGDGALALVQASGLLDDMAETDDGQEATCRMNRKGRKTPIICTFSMEDAKKAGLAGKAGPWTQYPARMRKMRARAFAMRDGFSDVLKGLHIVEEVRDYAPMDGGNLSAAPTQPLTSAMLIEQAKPEQPADVPAAAVQSPEPAVEDAGQSAAPIPDDAEPGAASSEIPEAVLTLIGEINGCDTEELLFEVENAKANVETYKAQPAHIRAMIDAARDQRLKLLRGEMI